MVEFNPENKPIIQFGVGVYVPNPKKSTTNPNSIIINNEMAANVQNLNSVYTADSKITPASQNFQTQNQPPDEEPFIKTGESLSERLDRYYSGKYSKSNLEQKRELLCRYMTGHFQTLTNKTPAERIKIQLADYKKLLSNTQDPQDYRVLANQIEILEAPNQLPGAKAAIEQAKNPEFIKNAQIGIAEVISKCASENRQELTMIIVNADNFEAYKAGLEDLENIHGEQQIVLYEIYSRKVSNNFAEYKQQNGFGHEVAQGPLTKEDANSFTSWQWANMSVEERNNIQNLSMSNNPNAQLNALENGVNSENLQYAETLGGWGCKLDSENQKLAIIIIKATNNPRVWRAAGSTACEYDGPQNQNFAHETFFNTNDLETQNNLTENMGKYDKDAQLLILQRTMTSEYQDIINSAASLIHTLHPDNQYNAMQYVIDTGNEEAINYAAQYAHLCHEDVYDRIKNLLYNSGYDSVRYTLYCSEEKAKASSSGNISSSSSTASVQNFKKAKINEKIKIIKALSKSNKDSNIKELLRNATNAEKIAIISQLPESSLPAVLEIILDSNPSANILSKIATIIGNMNNKDQNNMIQSMLSKNSSKPIASKINLLDVSSQRIFIKEMAAKGKLTEINQERLSYTLKNYCTSLMKHTYE